MPDPSTPSPRRTHFDRAAATYEAAAHTQRAVAEELSSSLDVRLAPRTLLEFGCGTGLFTRMLARRFPDARIFAWDPSRGMIDEARRRAAADPACVRVEWSTACPDVCCDGLVSCSSLHWMRPLAATLAGWRRRCAPGGWLAVAAMGAGTFAELRAAYAAAAPDRASPAPLPAESEYRAALAAGGWETVSFSAENRTEIHPDARAFLDAIRRLGVTGAPYAGGGRPLSRAQWRRLLDYYDAHFPAPGGGVRATLRVIRIFSRPV